MIWRQKAPATLRTCATAFATLSSLITSSCTVSMPSSSSAEMLASFLAEANTRYRGSPALEPDRARAGSASWLEGTSGRGGGVFTLEDPCAYRSCDSFACAARRRGPDLARTSNLTPARREPRLYSPLALMVLVPLACRLDLCLLRGHQV